MAANLNKVFLMGNLTRDPELRYTPSGAAVTELGIAVNRYYTTKDNEKREEVTFVDVTVWNRMAENCCQYLKRGRPVLVEGYLKLDTWDDKTSGEKRSKLKVEADNVQFLGSARDEPGGGAPSSRDDEAPAPRRSSVAPSNGATAPARSNSNAGPSSTPRRPAPAPDPEADDDIPF